MAPVARARRIRTAPPVCKGSNRCIGNRPRSNLAKEVRHGRTGNPGDYELWPALGLFPVGQPRGSRTLRSLSAAVATARPTRSEVLSELFKFCTAAGNRKTDYDSEVVLMQESDPSISQSDCRCGGHADSSRRSHRAAARAWHSPRRLDFGLEPVLLILRHRDCVSVFVRQGAWCGA